MAGEEGQDDRTLQHDMAIVVGVVLLLALPHVLLGPDITADDWVWVRNGEFLGWWDAGGSRQVGRPGAFALYALVFGLGGPHPLVHALVQLALWGLAAVAVLVALRQIVSVRLALPVVLFWLVVPTHLTLELWASTSQAWVAIICLALGSLAIAGRARGERPLWPALLLLGAAGAFYEVAILAAPVCAVAVDRHVRGRWHWSTLAWSGLACAPALAWSLLSSTVYTDEVGLPTTEEYWIEHLAGSVGLGIPVDRQGLATIAVIVWVCCLAFLVRMRDAGVERSMALAGAAIVVAGTIPAMRAYTIPFGMGDRLTAVSGVGAAMFWVGFACSLGLTRQALVAMGFVVVVFGMAARVSMVNEWNDVGDEAADVTRDLIDAQPGSVLVVAGPLASDRRSYGLSDGWNTTAAVQVVAGDATRVVQVDVGCIRSGPPPDEPLQQYGVEAPILVPGCERS